MHSIKLLVKKQRSTSHKAIRRTGINLALTAGVLCAAQAAHAQNTGSIFGNVTDKTGAAVVKAEITAADTDHGVTRTAKSNGSGEFTLDQLPTGNYILTVAAPLFETSVITDIKVDAASNTKEIIKLQTGSASDTITVEDTSGSALDAKSATLGTLIDQRLIEDLPIDGHNVVALSALLPGVVDVNAPATFTGDTGGPTYSASGSRNTQNLFLFDGIIYNNLYYNTGVNFPTPNALAEVSVLLNNYKAQFGRNAGSVFNVLTKRGTNTFHGAVWDYLQNQLFNAADYITQVNPKDNQNQFGFTIQGPVSIPHFFDGRDKLFFAGAYQQLIGHLQTTGSALTPGFNERGLNADGSPHPCHSNGAFPGMQCADFSSDVLAPNAAGVLTQGKFLNPLLLDGTSGSMATGSNSQTALNNIYAQSGGTLAQSPCVTYLNQAATKAATLPYANTGKVQGTYLPFAEFPVACFDPVILRGNPAAQGIGGNIAQQGIFDRYLPISNGPGGVSGYAVTKSADQTGDKNGLIRIDYIPNGTSSIDARYNIFASTADFPPGVNSNSQGIASYGLVNAHAKGHFANVGYQRILSPTLLSNTRVAYKRFETTQFPDDPTTLNSFGGNFVAPGVPALPSLSAGSNTFVLGSTAQGYQDHINENVQVSQSISYTRGNHNILGGFDFLRLQYLTRSDYPGQISFSTTFTGLSTSDAEFGLANSVNAQNRLIQGGIQHDAFFFLQDDWRLTSRLTLNYGVRYELPFQWFEPHGQAATFIPGIQSKIFANAPGGLGFPGDPTVLPSLVPTDFNGIAPRVGFAYDVAGKGKLLIRGGYGIFFDAVNANVIGVGQPFHYSFFKLLPPGGASVPLATYGVDAKGVPDGSILNIPNTFDPKNPLFISPYSLFFPDPKFRTPYIMAVNFGFQYHIPHGGVLDANFVGKYARKLTVPVDLNPSIFDCSGGYFQADPARYCNNASTVVSSESARSRFADFNYGGGGIVDIESVANSSYNALQTQYTQRGGKYLNILSSYTYSRSIDIQTNGQTVSNSVPNVFNLASDRGPSDNNATHNFTLGWVVSYPRVTSFSAPVRSLLNDWVYTGSYLAHTGRPFSVTVNNDTALDDEPNQRAIIVPGMSPFLPKNRHRVDKVAQYFNPFAFTYPTRGTFSNVGRNAFIGPAYIMTNMTVGRDFPLPRIREGMRASFRAEAYNVFNTPNLANPNAVFSCSSTAVSSQIGPGYLGPPVACNSSTLPGGAAQSTPGTLGGIIAGTGKSAFGQVRSTFGNNGNTSTNGRKMQFALTLFY